jgi:hypothetical protein
MTLESFFNEIESTSFAVRYSVASGFSTVKNGLKDDEILAALIKEIEHSPEKQQLVLERLIKLITENDNPTHRNRYDETLTGYLFVLSRTDEQRTQKAVNLILQTPNLWWARRLAAELRQAHNVMENL